MGIAIHIFFLFHYDTPYRIKILYKSLADICTNYNNLPFVKVTESWLI